MVRTRRLAYGYALTPLWQGELLEGEPTPYAVSAVAFTVPAGERWILRDIILGCDSGVTGQFTELLVDPAGSDGALRVLREDLGTGISIRHYARDHVLEAGDQLVVASGLNLVRWYLTGAVLTI